MLSANQHAEIFACILLRIELSTSWESESRDFLKPRGLSVGTPGLHVDKPEIGKVSVISITPEQDVRRQ